jgi:predicted alpha-1,2-mannosidase
MQIMNMGNYAHGNQPIQHMLYLYNYAGKPWKTQKWVRAVMDRFYSDAPDGYCGDEDNGQTSAWYVFSAMGFYPVCPGSGQYVTGAPLFRKVSVHLPSGKTFSVTAGADPSDSPYVSSVTVDGKPWSKLYLRHEDLSSGASVVFNMGPEPATAFIPAAGDLPYSLSTTEKP